MCCRAEPDGSDYELAGILVYGAGGVVGGGQGDFERCVQLWQATMRRWYLLTRLRHMDRYGAGTRRHWAVCALENLTCW